MVLEYTPYLDLKKMMHERKRLFEFEVQYISSQILSALLHMQSKLIIHRDMKLANFLIFEGLIVKFCDFGLATQCENNFQRRFTYCGPVEFQSPEMIRGEGYCSDSVDKWGFGVIVFTLLFGEVPWELQKDERDTLFNIRTKELIFPKNIKVSEDARNLLTLILAKDPTNRPDFEEIASHPFFKRVKLPKALPVSFAKQAPDSNFNIQEFEKQWTSNQSKITKHTIEDEEDLKGKGKKNKKGKKGKKGTLTEAVEQLQLKAPEEEKLDRQPGESEMMAKLRKGLIIGIQRKMASAAKNLDEEQLPKEPEKPKTNPLIEKFKQGLREKIEKQAGIELPPQKQIEEEQEQEEVQVEEAKKESLASKVLIHLFNKSLGVSLTQGLKKKKENDDVILLDEQQHTNLNSQMYNQLQPDGTIVDLRTNKLNLGATLLHLREVKQQQEQQKANEEFEKWLKKQPKEVQEREKRAKEAAIKRAKQVQQKKEEELNENNATVYKPDGKVDLGKTFENLRKIKAQIEKKQQEEERKRKEQLNAGNATVYKPDGTVDLGKTFANLREIKARMEQKAKEEEERKRIENLNSNNATVYKADGTVDLGKTFANLRLLKAKFEAQKKEEEELTKNATVYKPDGRVDLPATFANLRAIKAKLEARSKERLLQSEEKPKEEEPETATVYLPNGRVDLKATFANLRAIKERQEYTEKLNEINNEISNTKDEEKLKELRLEANRIQLLIMKGPAVKITQVELRSLFQLENKVQQPSPQATPKKATPLVQRLKLGKWLSNKQEKSKSQATMKKLQEINIASKPIKPAFFSGLLKKVGLAKPRQTTPSSKEMVIMKEQKINNFESDDSLQELLGLGVVKGKSTTEIFGKNKKEAQNKPKKDSVDSVSRCSITSSEFSISSKSSKPGGGEAAPKSISLKPLMGNIDISKLHDSPRMKKKDSAQIVDISQFAAGPPSARGKLKVSTPKNQIKLEHSFVFVQKWVDYTSKYGVGYLMSNGDSGVLLQDKTKMIMKEGAKNYTLIKNDNTQEDFSLNNDDDPIIDKVHLLINFGIFLRRKNDTRCSQLQPSPQAPKTQIHLLKFVKRQNSTILCLSNKVVQVQFKDKTELMIDQANKIIVYINGQTQVFTNDQAKKSSDREFLKRLKYIRLLLTKDKPKKKVLPVKQKPSMIKGLTLELPKKLGIAPSNSSQRMSQRSNVTNEHSITVKSSRRELADMIWEEDQKYREQLQSSINQESNIYVKQEMSEKLQLPIYAQQYHHSSRQQSQVSVRSSHRQSPRQSSRMARSTHRKTEDEVSLVEKELIHNEIQLDMMKQINYMVKKQKGRNPMAANSYRKLAGASPRSNRSQYQM